MVECESPLHRSKGLQSYLAVLESQSHAQHGCQTTVVRDPFIAPLVLETENRLLLTKWAGNFAVEKGSL